MIKLAPGLKVTAYEVYHESPFYIKRFVQWGCYAAPHLKAKQCQPGKDTAKAKPGIFLKCSDHKGFSTCQILDPKTQAITYVPFEQVNFHQDCFPYRDPKGQSWQPLEIRELANS